MLRCDFTNASSALSAIVEIHLARILGYINVFVSGLM